MTKSRLGTVVLLALGAVLVFSSCGGGGSKRLTKKQYAAKADTLCAAFNKQVNAVPTPKTIAEAATSFEKLLPLDRKLVADMKALKPPANEENVYSSAAALDLRFQPVQRVRETLRRKSLSGAGKLLLVEADCHQRRPYRECVFYPGLL